MLALFFFWVVIMVLVMALMISSMFELELELECVIGVLIKGSIIGSEDEFDKLTI